MGDGCAMGVLLGKDYQEKPFGRRLCHGHPFEKRLSGITYTKSKLTH